MNINQQEILTAYNRVYIIAVVGTISSILAFLLALNQNIWAFEDEFRRDISTRVLSLRHKIETLEQFLEDIQNFYASSEDVRKDEFYSFVAPSLQRNDLSFVGWIPADASDLSPGSFYLAVKPVLDAEAMLKILTEGRIVRDTLDRARQNKSMAVSQAFSLLVKNSSRKEETQKHVAIIVPTFKAVQRQNTPPEISGFVVTFLEISRLFADIFQGGKLMSQKSNIYVYMPPVEDGGQKQLVFKYQEQADVIPGPDVGRFFEHIASFSTPHSLHLGSKTLEVVATPSFSHLVLSSQREAWIALTAGMAITAALAFWFYQQITQTLQVRRLVDDRTRKLASSEKHMRAVLDNTVDGIITIDERGTVQTYNPACETIFGYKAAEVIGHNVKMLMPDSYRRQHDSYVANYMRTGQAKIIGIGREVEGRKKDGSIFPMELSIGEIKNSDHSSFVGIVRDISRRKESDRNKSLLASIVENSEDAIISKTLDSVVTSWNNGARHLFGYSAEEAIGRNVKELLIPPERYHEEEEIIESLKDGKRILHFETQRLNKNGKLLDVALTVSPIKDENGNVIGASKVARDIGARKKAEAQLLEYTEQLKRSNQELDDFVYIVSHDLKEPLRGLHSYAQFLQEDYSDRLPQDGVDKLATLKKLAVRMEYLIDTLLKYSRLGRSELAFKKTNLNTTVSQVLELLSTVIEEQNVRVKINGKLPSVICDRAYIGEVFHNLIMNGIKYNDSGEKRIEIGHMTAHKDFPEQTVFYIKDNGIGIAEEYHETVFKMFKRLHGPKAYGGGTGSGLAIVKKIIDRHGGKIWIESREGEGTVFYFTLGEENDEKQKENRQASLHPDR